VIVDTTIWVDYLRGLQNPETEWLNAALERQRLGLTDLILCEVLQGVRDDRSFSRVLRQLRVSLKCSKPAVWSSRSRQRGIPQASRTWSHGPQDDRLLDCDLLPKGGHALLHRDRDFDPFEQILGLLVIRPRLSG
jgi:hypothetical protein